MNFTEAVNEVLAIVKRPDKILDIRREVNAAVNFFCADTDFKRDVEEVLLAIDPLQYSQNLPYTSFTRFRKVQFMKRGGTREYLTLLEAKTMPAANCSLDKFYLAGSGIRINMAKLAANLDIGYFQYPPTLTDAAGTFWLLDVSPYMVIDRAASKIFVNIGDTASATPHANSSSAAYLAFRSDQKSA